MSRTKEAIEMLKTNGYDITDSINDTLATLDPEADPEDTEVLARMLKDIIYDEIKEAALKAIFQIRTPEELPPGVKPGRG